MKKAINKLPGLVVFRAVHPSEENAAILLLSEIRDRRRNNIAYFEKNQNKKHDDTET